MKTTELSTIEEIVTIETEFTGYFNLDFEDYEKIKGRYGAPSVAISTGECDSVSAVIKAFKQDLEGEILSTVKAGMLFIDTSKECSMTMADLSEINSLFDGIPGDATIKRSVGWSEKENMNKIIVILWK